MDKFKPVFGDILTVELPDQNGHEQHGERPAICIFNPCDLGIPRFEIILIAPLTTNLESWVTKAPKLYPVIPGQAGNVSKSSAVLLDQIRSIDVKRIVRHSGCLTSIQKEYIRERIKAIIPSKK